MDKYINYEMCKECKGACCKENGCVYAPSDFNSMDYRELLKIINKGKISISGQPIPFGGNNWTYVPYLRARNVGSPVVDLISNGGPCVNLTDVGCALSLDARPAFGLLVKPTQIGGPCKCVDEVIDDDWLSFCDVLDRLIHFYTHNDLFKELVCELEVLMYMIESKIDSNEKLTPMEEQNLYWYYSIIEGRNYYSPQEILKLTLKK